MIIIIEFVEKVSKMTLTFTVRFFFRRTYPSDVNVSKWLHNRVVQSSMERMR